MFCQIMINMHDYSKQQTIATEQYPKFRPIIINIIIIIIIIIIIPKFRSKFLLPASLTHKTATQRLVTCEYRCPNGWIVPARLEHG